MEKNIATRVDKWLAAQRDVFFFNVHGSHFQKRGMPDRVGNCGAVAFYIELKQSGKNPEPIQAAIARKIRRSGGFVRTCRSLEEVKEFIRDLREIALDATLRPGILRHI